jgi:hypothetical protein
MRILASVKSRVKRGRQGSGMRRVQKPRRIFWIASLLCTALIAFVGHTLLRPPCVGVADNGDYWRVMRPAGIEHLEPVKRPGRFVQCEYRGFDGDLAQGVSSPAVVAWLAKRLSWGLSDGPGRVDLRQVGVLYLLLVVAIVGLALARGAPPLLVTLWTYVLADPGYFLFFNSFYADPALLVALLGVGLWLVGADASARRGPRAEGAAVASGAGLVLLALLGGASKMQNVLFPAATLLALGSLAWRPISRVRSAWAARAGSKALVATFGLLVVLAIALPWLFFRGPAPRFPRVNAYHAVFAGILQVTDRPEAAADRLDVHRAYLDLPRRDVWSGRVPLDHPVFDDLSRLSRWRLLALYLGEPAAVARSARRLAEALAAESPHRRGTYPRGTGHRAYAQLDLPWQLSRFRRGVLAPWPGAIWMVPVGAFLWLALSAARRQWGGRQAAALFLLAFGASQLMVIVLGDGFVALEQHLLGARLAFDLLLLLGLHSAAGAAREAMTANREGVEKTGEPRDRHGSTLARDR